MEANRTLKITNLEVEIALLQVDERRLQSVIHSTLTAPELRTQAQIHLRQTLEKITAAIDEIARLESER